MFEVDVFKRFRWWLSFYLFHLKLMFVKHFVWNTVSTIFVFKHFVWNLSFLAICLYLFGGVRVANFLFYYLLLCCVFVFYLSSLCVWYPLLPVFLDCSFLFIPSIFFNFFSDSWEINFLTHYGFLYQHKMQGAKIRNDFSSTKVKLWKSNSTNNWRLLVYLNVDDIICCLASVFGRSLLIIILFLVVDWFAWSYLYFMPSALFVAWRVCCDIVRLT